MAPPRQFVVSRNEFHLVIKFKRVYINKYWSPTRAKNQNLVFDNFKYATRSQSVLYVVIRVVIVVVGYSSLANKHTRFRYNVCVPSIAFVRFYVKTSPEQMTASYRFPGQHPFRVRTLFKHDCNDRGKTLATIHVDIRRHRVKYNYYSAVYL